MITAEDDARCAKIKEPNKRGPLAVALKGFYLEMQLSNYLREPLYLITADDTEYLIEPVWTSNPECRVEIMHRCINGDRAPDHLYAERATTTHHTLTLPHPVLRAGPVYVRTHNVVVCTSEHRTNAVHPYSRKHVKDRLTRWHDELSRSLTQMPVSVVANDPTGEVKQLFLAINDRICAARVTNFPEFRGGDVVSIAYRDVPAPDGGVLAQVVVDTSFGELRAKGREVWTLNGVTFSTSRTLLEMELETRALRETAETIPVDEHRARIEAVHDSYAVMAEDNKRLARTANDLKKALDQLNDGRYGEELAQLRWRELSLEHSKQETQRAALEAEQARAEQKARHEAELARAQAQRELIKTTEVLLKAAAVIIPAVFGLYKLFALSKKET